MYYQQDEGEPAMNLHDKRVKIIAAVLAILLIVIGVRIFMNVMSAKEKAARYCDCSRIGSRIFKARYS